MNWWIVGIAVLYLLCGVIIAKVLGIAGRRDRPNVWVEEPGFMAIFCTASWPLIVALGAIMFVLMWPYNLVCWLMKKENP